MYIINLCLFGDLWAAEIVAYGIVLWFSYRNWYISGCRSLRHYYGKGFFVIISAAASLVHLADLAWMTYVGDFPLLAVGVDSHYEGIILVIFGLVVPAIILYYTSMAIQVAKARIIDDRELYRKLRSLSFRRF